MAPVKFSLIGLAVVWMAQLLYLTSLTSLIPFGAFFLTAGLENLPESTQSIPYTALILLAVSLLILFFYYRDFARVLSSLGWMTLLPGFVAAFFLLFKREAVLGLLAKVIVGFGTVEPFIEAYLEKSVPTLWIFIVVYVVLGTVFIHLAETWEQEKGLRAKISGLFGPRARIVR